MTIGKKIFGGFGILLTILLVFSFYSISQQKHITNSYEEMLETQVHMSLSASAVKTEMALQGMYMSAYLADQRDVALENFKKHQAILKEEIDNLATHAQAAEMKQMIQQMRDDLIIYDKSAAEIFRLIQANDLVGAKQVMETDNRPVNIAIQQGGEDMQVFQEKSLAENRALTKAAAAKSQRSLLIAAIFDIILSLIIAFLIFRAISSPIKRLSTATTILASGDLTQDDIQVKANDEIRELANAFNTMKHNLRNVISTISDNALRVTASAEELSASTQEVTRASQEVSRNMDEISTGSQISAASAKESSLAMEETAIGVQRIAESASHLNVNADETEKLAENSRHSVQLAKDQMDVIYDSSQLTSELIQRLSKQTIEIENITKVITDITEQTNLLALNAAIEAARAGEQGKGFAVVANEVRNLAEQSKNSASQIVKLTADIQVDTKNVETSIEQSLKNAKQGVQVIDEAGTAFLNIIGAIQTMGGQIEEISAATEEISASAEEVSASVQEIASQANEASAQTEQNSGAVDAQIATIEEINTVAHDLSEQAMDLQQVIHAFKL